ncbi:uncharacterized protein LOC106361508 [Brassica napus]|nr:uncharacterized protein LOC106361508 [Brassica napus]
MGQRRWNPGIRENLLKTVFDWMRYEGKSGICRRDWGGQSRSDQGLVGESSRYGKRIGLSDFLKPKSFLIEGTISVIINTESFPIVSMVNSYQLRSRKVGFWKIRIFSFFLKSQLIGGSGEMKNDDGARKRLKISVPHFNNSDLIKGYSKTLIGRCMNPEEQNVKFLVVTLPKIWNLEDKVVGTDLGLGRFQFDFDAEEDIETVLKMQPFHFDYWMISLVRWQPRKTKNYPSEITFWIKVLGVPLEFWEAPTFRSIGDAHGVTKDVDLDYGRVQVTVDGYKELIFETTVDFKGGEYYEEEEAPVTLRYEKLFGYCKTCFSLCHKMEKCPQTIQSTDKPKEIRDEDESHYDDKARSYKGVVINGNGGQQDRVREKREYQGKGKGKMFEEGDTKWVKASDRERKTHNNNHRSGHRGGDENSRHRSYRRDQSRTHQDDRVRAPAGLRGATSAGSEARTDGCEEGEIVGMEQSRQKEEKIQVPAKPSQAFLAELLETQEGHSKVTLERKDGDQGLVLEQMGLDLMEVNSLASDVGLGLEEQHSGHIGNGTGETLANVFSALNEEEFEDDDPMQEVVADDPEEKKKIDNSEVNDRVNGEVEKRQGARRKALKPSLAAVASNKMKLAQLVAAKRTVVKAGMRHGDSSKQGEEKGPLAPKHDPAKYLKDP